MCSRFASVSSLALLMTAPLYSADLAADLGGAEREIRTAISSLPDPISEHSVALWSTLGTIHQEESKLSDAEQDYRHALNVNRSLRIPNKLEEASILNNLATVLEARRDFKGAAVILEEGLRVVKDNNLEGSPTVGPLRTNTALNLQQLGKIVEAEHVYGEAELSFERSHAADTADFAMLLSNFGLLNFEIGHYTEGIARQRRALDIQAKLPSIPRKQRAYVLNNLGLGLVEINEFREAKSYFLQAIELERNGPPALTRHLVEALDNVAVLEQKTGHYVEAKNFQVEAEQIASKTLSQDDPIWASIWNNLGMIAILQRDRRTGKDFYEKSAALWLRTLGPASPQYSGTLSNMASLESLCGHHKQAQEMAARALAIDKAFFGPDHPRVASDLANLATEMFYRHKREEAIDLLLLARGIQEKAEPRNNLSLARTLDDLAAAHQQLNRLTEARQFYEQAIHAYDSQPPASLAQYAACLHQYAGLLRQMQNYADAEQAEVRATRLDVQSVLKGQSPSPQAIAAGYEAFR